MKIRKIALCILVCFLMVSVTVLGVACNKETKMDLKAAADWKQFETIEEAEIDTIKASNDSDGNLVITFNGSFEYGTIVNVLAAKDSEILAKMKTLVVKAKMTTDNPYPSIMFKLETLGKEVKVKGTADYTTYEWDVSEFDLTKETWLDIFPDPGVKGTTGKITISEIYFTDKAMNADNDATKMPPDTAPQVDPNAIVWNEVTAAKKTIKNWYDGGNGVYTVTEQTGGKFKVDVNKVIGSEWAAVISYIHGDALKTMKSFKMVLKGEAGKTVLVKPFDANSLEKSVTFTGEEQEVVVDIASYAADTARDFSKKGEPTADNRVALLALPGVASGTTSFEIISAEFSTEAVVVEDPDTNVITATERTVMKGWAPLDAGTYTVTQVQNTLKVAYTTSDYKWLRTYVKGDAIATMKTIEFTVKGTAGKTIMFKPFNENSLEKTHTFTGMEDKVSVDISAYVAAQSFGAKVPVLLSIEPGVNNATGEFTIINVEFSTNEYSGEVAPKDITNVITASNHKVTEGWHPLDAGTYTVTADGAAYDVAYDTADSYQFLRAYVTGAEIANMKVVSFILSGTQGKQILVKFLGVEHTITLGAGETEDFLDYSAKIADTHFDTRLEVLICAEPGAPAEGEFRIHSVEFYAEADPVLDPEAGATIITNVDRVIDSAWVDSGDGVYTIDADTPAYNVTFSKGTSEWATMKTLVKGKAISRMKTLVFTISGDADLELLLKPFDAVEQRVTLDGTEQKFVVDISEYVAGKAFATSLPIYIFAAPGTAQVTGEFRIISVEFSTEEKKPDPIPASEYGGSQLLSFNNYWRDGGDGKWTAAEAAGIWTLSYAAGHSWGSVVTNISLGDAVMNYLVVEVKSAVGIPVIVKFANGNEVSVTGNGEFQKIGQKLSANVTGDVTVLVFAGWDDANEGSIEFKNLTLYYVSASEVQSGNLAVAADFKHADKGDTRFTIATSAGKTTITNANPTEANGGGWDSLLLWVDLGQGGYDTLTLTFKGQEGHIAIVKLNNEGTRQKEFSAGQGGALTGADETVTLNAQGLTGVVEIRLFLDWDGPAGGVFEVSNIQFTKTAA